MLNNTNAAETANWCINTGKPGTIVTEWDAVKQRIAIALRTAKLGNPLKPYYFTDIPSYIDKNVNVAIPNIKKDIAQVVAKVAPEIVVNKITTTTDSTGKVLFKISLKQGDTTDVLVLNPSISVVEFTNNNTVILEADIPVFVEGLIYGELTLDNNTTIRTGLYTDPTDIYNEFTSSYSQYGYYGYTNLKLVGYLDQKYAKAKLAVKQIYTITIGDITGLPSGKIYVNKIRLGGIVDDTDRVFATITDLMTFLSGTFTTTNGLLGIFVYSSNTIRYMDIENFGDGEVLFDTQYFVNKYPGAAAIYSFELLNPAYTGKCIRVRRSSDNAESDIGFVGRNFDIAAFNTFIGVNTASVVKLYDQSGNAYNWSQSTATNQPQTDGTKIKHISNGSPGSNNFLTQTRVFGSSASLGSYVHFFLVAKNNTMRSFSTLVDYDSNGGNLLTGWGIRQGNQNSGTTMQSWGGTSPETYVNNTVRTSSQYTLTTPTNLKVYSIKINGFTTNGNNRFVLGRSDYDGTTVGWDGEFRELIVYLADKTADRVNITNYLNMRYGAF